jgi:hypothetical protein
MKYALASKRVLIYSVVHIMRLSAPFTKHASAFLSFLLTRPVRRGVSKGEEDGRRPPALRVGYPSNGCRRVGHGGPG